MVIFLLLMALYSSDAYGVRSIEQAITTVTRTCCDGMYKSRRLINYVKNEMLQTF